MGGDYAEVAENADEEGSEAEGEGEEPHEWHCLRNIANQYILNNTNNHLDTKMYTNYKFYISL